MGTELPPKPTPRTPSPTKTGDPVTVPHAAALQAPWRLDYLERAESVEKHPNPAAAPPGASFLSDYWNAPERDEQNHVIFRTPTGFVLLNGFPYTSGHLLVALSEPRPTLLDYSAAQRADLWRHVDLAMALMQETLQPQGMNVGVNQGRAAGAGIPQHLHVHLVPRWGGDVNFMSTIGQVRIIPASLEKMTEKYRAAWARAGGLLGWEQRIGLRE